MRLNDIPYKRPYLLPSLFNFLLNFSVKPIAVTADIKKAFLQIAVNEIIVTCYVYVVQKSAEQKH